MRLAIECYNEHGGQSSTSSIEIKTETVKISKVFQEASCIRHNLSTMHHFPTPADIYLCSKSTAATAVSICVCEVAAPI
jgi:hypothetical protein